MDGIRDQLLNILSEVDECLYVLRMVTDHRLPVGPSIIFYYSFSPGYRPGAASAGA